MSVLEDVHFAASDYDLPIPAADGYKPTRSVFASRASSISTARHSKTSTSRRL
jgi:hypothetical protein